MKRSDAVSIALLVAFLSLSDMAVSATNPAVSATNQDAAEAQAVIKQYLHYFDAQDYAGMESVTTPDLVVVDYGQRLNRAEWDWFMRMNDEVKIIGADKKKKASIDPIRTWDFDTRVVSNDVAYSNFKEAWRSNPKFVEASIMVLRRIGGKWLIDRWSVQEGGAWYKWLRERIRAKGGKVEANWYELYKKERAAEVKPKYN